MFHVEQKYLLFYEITDNIVTKIEFCFDNFILTSFLHMTLIGIIFISYLSYI